MQNYTVMRDYQNRRGVQPGISSTQDLNFSGYGDTGQNVVECLHQQLQH